MKDVSDDIYDKFLDCYCNYLDLKHINANDSVDEVTNHLCQEIETNTDYEYVTRRKISQEFKRADKS